MQKQLASLTAPQAALLQAVEQESRAPEPNATTLEQLIREIAPWAPATHVRRAIDALGRAQVRDQ